jgi:hypothetical protein
MVGTANILPRTCSITSYVATERIKTFLKGGHQNKVVGNLSIEVGAAFCLKSLN